jgi:hypothetical protein
MAADQAGCRERSKEDRGQPRRDADGQLILLSTSRATAAGEARLVEPDQQAESLPAQLMPEFDGPGIM